MASVFLSTVLGICAESLNLVFQEEVLQLEVQTHNPPLLLLLPPPFVPACWAAGVARVSWQTWWWMASEDTCGKIWLCHRIWSTPLHEAIDLLTLVAQAPEC